MPIITLTTDWNGEYYIAATKGAILKELPDVIVIDISHQIKPFKSAHAAFVLKNSYRNFPDGTVHIIGVNTESTKKEPLVVCQIHNQFFIGIDNGQFSLINPMKPQKIVKIQPDKFNLQFQSFPVLGLFIGAACKLASGEDIMLLGNERTSINIQPEFLEAIDDNSINARVIYIDSYGNAITNLTRETFERVGKNRNFTLHVLSRRNKITKINNFYNETENGQLLAIFNSINLLEIAIKEARVDDLLGVRKNDAGIIIRFTPSI